MAHHWLLETAILMAHHWLLETAILMAHCKEGVGAQCTRITERSLKNFYKDQIRFVINNEQIIEAIR